MISKLPAALLLLSALTAPAFAGSSTQRDAPTTVFRDSRGNVTGSASTYGNQTKFYEARGNLVGTATQRGK
jgi:hypothetical protein